MNEQTFDQYIQTVRSLTIPSDNPDTSLEELSKLIDDQLQTVDEGNGYEEFLKGEKAFFQGQYQLALKHYLAAKGVPNFHFFCYRTSAFVSKDLGHHDKAITYAQKALEIYPDDYATLEFLRDLFESSGEVDQAANIHTQINGLIGDQTQSSNTDTKEHIDTSVLNEQQSVYLGERELSDLTTIFDTGQEDVDLSTLRAHSLHANPIPFSGEGSYDTALEPEESAEDYSFLAQTDKDPQRDESSMLHTDTQTTDTSVTSDLGLSQDQQSDSYPADLETSTGISSTSSAPEKEETLKDLVDSDYNVGLESTDRFLADSLGMEIDNNQSLERRIKTYQRTQAEAIIEYLKQGQNPTFAGKDFLFVLHGWQEAALSHIRGNHNTETLMERFLLPERHYQTNGGLYLRWNGKGIVINPGPNFLRHFHQEGLHIRDIDHVIVTRNHPQAYEDIQHIYKLNQRLNAVDTDLHIINYYLNQQTHRLLATTLKPYFKQERNTVHCLELYVDSPDLETIELSDGLLLKYFPLNLSNEQKAKATNSDTSDSALGCRLELSSSYSDIDGDRLRAINLAYVSGAAWNPMIAQHLNSCDIIITGFGDTGVDDYSRLKYNDSNLGYFGNYTVIEESNPKILICCEFGGREGDIRVEVAKKLRQEYAYGAHNNTVVLPGDTGLYVDLSTQKVRCGVSKQLVDPSKIRVVKSKDSFGKLQYLSPNCFV